MHHTHMYVYTSGNALQQVSMLSYIVRDDIGFETSKLKPKNSLNYVSMWICPLVLDQEYIFGQDLILIFWEIVLT